MLTDDKKRVFDDILGEKQNKGICHFCGEIQAYKLRWCRSCGNEYCNHEHTLLEFIKIQSDKIPGRPGFYAAIFARKLKRLGISVNEFENYINHCLEEKTKMEEKQNLPRNRRYCDICGKPLENYMEQHTLRDCVEYLYQTVKAYQGLFVAMDDIKKGDRCTITNENKIYKTRDVNSPASPEERYREKIDE